MSTVAELAARLGHAERALEACDARRARAEQERAELRRRRGEALAAGRPAGELSRELDRLATVVAEADDERPARERAVVAARAELTEARERERAERADVAERRLRELLARHDAWLRSLVDREAGPRLAELRATSDALRAALGAGRSLDADMALARLWRPYTTAGGPPTFGLERALAALEDYARQVPPTSGGDER